MRNSLTSLLLALCLALTLIACEGDEGPDAPRPECEQRADARFKVYERFFYAGRDTIIETDTIRQGSDASFIADQAQSSYRWRIGDPINTFTTRRVNLGINVSVNNTIGLRTTYVNPCTGLSETDSTTRNFQVRPYDYNRFFGYFQISTSRAPADTFTIRVEYQPTLAPPCADPIACVSRWRIANLPKGTTLPAKGGGGASQNYGYRKLFLEQVVRVPGQPFNGDRFELVMLIRYNAAADSVRGSVYQYTYLAPTVPPSAPFRYTNFLSYTFTGRRL